MPTARPKLSRVAQAGIRELRSEHGVEPTLDEIIWLHELGKIQEASGRIDGILEGPAQAGKAFLWPMTIMAAQWYRNYAEKWFRVSPLYFFYALAFALAHGRGQPVPDTAKRGWFERMVRKICDVREEKILADLTDRTEATNAIQRWVAETGATREELDAAIDAVLPAPDASEKKADKPGIEDDEDFDLPTGVNYDDVVHELSMLSGTEPDYWRTRTSKDATIQAYMNAIMIERARRQVDGPRPIDALGKAIQNFRHAITAIIKAHSTETQQEGAE